MAFADVLSLLAKKRTWAWALLHEGLAVFLCTWPPIRLVCGTPGFEFSFLQGLLAAISAGHLGVMAAHRAREAGPSASAGALVGRAWLAALGTASLLLAAPLATVLVAGLWNGRCDYAGGLAFYALLPWASAILSSALGVTAGLALRRSWVGTLVFVALALSCAGYSIWRLLSQAPVFAYDPFFGYFPGALYDELVTIGGPLLAFRLETVLVAASILLLARAFADPARGRLRPRAVRASALAAALPALAGAVLLRAHGAELGYFISTDDVARALGVRRETEHFVIYLPRGHELVRHAEEIARDHEFRYEQLRRYLGAEPAGKVHSFVFADAAQKARLMGARAVSIAKPWIRHLYLHDMGTPHPVLRHELAHVFGGAFGSWFGVSATSPLTYNVGLIEGLAVAADWSAGWLNGHQWARAARAVKGKDAPRASDLLGAAGFWGRGARLAYMLSGSFVRFLIDEYGAARFREAYPSGDFPKAYGASLNELGERWERWLDRNVTLGTAELRAAQVLFRRPSIFRRRCAHEVARRVREAEAAVARGDRERAVERWRDALALHPGSLGHIEALARALLRAQQGGEAAALAAQALHREREGVERLREIQADAAWVAGRIREARSTYGALLSEGPPPDDARRLAVKMAALEHAEAGPRVRRFLLEDGPDRTPAFLELGELVVRVPAFAPGHYLLGRQLVFARRWSEAALRLQEAARLGLPGRELPVETWRLLGIAAYHLGDFAGARARFDDVRRSGLSAGTALEAQDWIERCNFAAARRRRLSGRP